MVEIKNYIDCDIKLINATQKDIELYYEIKKQTCEGFVKKYFGVWNEKEQREYNDKIFKESLTQNFFKIITKDNQPIGFFGYSIFTDKIGCVTLQIINIQERNKIFKALLNYLSEFSKELDLPIYAKSFLDSKDIYIFESVGFKITSTTNSHYLLKKENKGNIMKRNDYENFVKEKFNDKTKDLMLNQIDNFYQLANINLKHKKYKLNDDVVLNKGNLMTGFKFDLNYLNLISKEGKICGDYAGIESKHGIKWAVSTWKFTKKIKLKDYVVNYSGMTVVYNGIYEIVPYGKLDEFVEKLKKKEHFLWEAESTREMRFLPNDIRQNGNVALIFNVKNKACEKLLENELQKEFIPQEIRVGVNNNEKNKTRMLMDKGFGERVAYILFGIPKNCIEGIFVNRQIEKNQTQLSKIKKLFPNCYICNIDGKVIVE
ncbi:MAG: hypothetical protein IJW82_01375 [Clostridia bacterium]|nr:hypothetical protein [Clostridia bacterium]